MWYILDYLVLSVFTGVLFFPDEYIKVINVYPSMHFYMKFGVLGLLFLDLSFLVLGDWIRSYRLKKLTKSE